MLLVIDVGNTHTVLGVYRDDELLHRWRVTSDVSRTVDEYAALCHQLFQLSALHFSALNGVVISSVVPPLVKTLETLCRRYLNCSPCVVGPGIETGMPIHYDDPGQVGADRLVNAVAAYEKYRRSLIIVDLGTATTFDCISADGCFEGGAIAPGLGISAEALFSRTRQLPPVEFKSPPQVIGKNTEHSMQSGIFYGYVGLVDGIVERMQRELPDEPLTVATGGLAAVIVAASRTISVTDADLTLDGLRIIYQRNKQRFDTLNGE
ncbi:MAG: type III pantothenate kinase [Desulfuromonadaceae bacterium]|nr:type III pantothenate kinase [Desulfuromonadaceae bacterium]